ncbi:AAA family ATPase [Maricaulis sp.]|uniref:AAA family ATPase n=1 Tax=Maricaulis sp. TaxID=1486257 RepID=UPI0025BC3967|nr:AAA family ATPase [Maricaulis sp.]
MPLPAEVFTPRSADINPKMYVERPSQEKSVRQALLRDSNFFMHGESGSGKSWLYKKIFAEKRISYFVIDCSKATEAEGLRPAYLSLVRSLGVLKKTSVSDERLATADAIVVKGSQRQTTIKENFEQDPLETLFAAVRSNSGKKQAFIIFDNFEHAINSPKKMEDIASAIIARDNSQYDYYNVRIAIVGVPDDIVSYFSKQNFSQTISNRIFELPEVGRLTGDQCKSIIERGFFELLKYKINVNKEDFVRFLVRNSDLIPQHVQALCLEIAIEAHERNKTIDIESINTGVRSWLRGSLHSEYARISARMNKRNSRRQRRNQVLYAISRCSKHEFNYLDIEQIVKNEFSDTQDVAVNVSGTLSTLAQGENPILRRTPDSKGYRFANPKTRICAGLMLHLDEDGVVNRTLLDGDDGVKAKWLS